MGCLCCSICKIVVAGYCACAGLFCRRGARDMARAVGFADLYFRIFDYGEQHMCPDRGKAVLIAGYWSGICSMAAAIF